MKTRSRACIFVTLWLVAGAVSFAASSDSTMAFTVSMDNPASHMFHVVLRCTGLKGETQDFKMPVWMPGYYGIIDYAGNVQDFRAIDGSGKPLELEKSSANTWRVRTGNASPLTISYDVKATVQFIVQSYLDENRAYIAPVGVFMHAGGQIGHPVTVTVKPYEKWKDVATGLDPVPGKPNTFTALDFDVLYDCPILVGNLERLSFAVRGIPHAFVGYNLGDFNRAEFTSDLKRMVEAAVSIIDEIPYKHYTFLAVGPGRGGIEHLNSTAVSLDGLSGYSSRKQRGTLEFLAHEYFHLYNVKSIRPFELGPFDYDRPNRTRLLWMSEGFTIYYEYLILRRAGFTTADEMLASVGSPIAGYENRPGRLLQSAAQSSYGSWDQGPFGGDPEKSISYYDKGAGIALLLDLKIRHETRGVRSLDDVMRTLYREYYKEKKRGFTDAEFQDVCERIAGIPLGEIFEYADTTKAIDYPKYLGYAGLEVELPKELDEADLGASVGERDGRLVVWRAASNSPAGHVGIAPRDVILAIDGIPVDAAAMKKAIDSKRPGDTITVRFSRGGEEKEVLVVLAKKIDPGYRIKRIPNPTPDQEKIYLGWIGR
ncbi:MAG: PDZ domain-containing protein [Candidatus Aminicenantes bacterium]|nr:PDZ domain-containing protein [Candidatus Aminicenantes bacterium]